MLRRNIYLLLFISLTVQSLPAQVWQALGPDGTNNPSLDFGERIAFAVASNGDLYVAFADGSVNYKATVRKFDGSTWTTVGSPGFTPGSMSSSFSSPSLAVDGVTPYFAYRDATNGGRAAVKKFDGVTWVTVGPGAVSAQSLLGANATSLAMYGSTPYLAYNQGSGGVMVKVFDGTNWVTVGAGFLGGGAGAGTLKLAFSGITPYVAYSNANNGSKATVKKYDNTAWVDVGTPGFSTGATAHLSLAFDGGMPYLAYRDGANGNRATLKKFDGTTWVGVGSPDVSTGVVQSVSLAFSGGMPCIAYSELDANGNYIPSVKKYDGANWVPVGQPGLSFGFYASTSLTAAGSTLYLAYENGQPVVERWDGTAWTNVGSGGISTEVPFTTSLAISGSTPYIATVDAAAQPGKVSVRQWNGSAWVDVGTPISSAGYAYHASLALSGTYPAVAYNDFNNGSPGATVQLFDGSAWNPVGPPGFTGGGIEYPSLAFDGATPYLAYPDPAVGLKATVKTFDGVNWVDVGTAGFSASYVQNISLVLSGSTPYVAYQDGDIGSKATVKTFDGSNWVDVGAAGFTAGSAGYLSLALSGATPYVAYADAANGNKATVKKFDGAAWVDVGAPGFSTASASDIVFTFSGATPCVAYSDVANGYKMTVKRFDGTAWVDVGVPGFSTGGAYGTSLKAAGSTLFISYSGGYAYAKKFDCIVPPVASITGVTTICAGQSTTLTASGGGDYEWSNNAGTTASILVTPTADATYTVTVTGADGCTGTAQATVMVLPVITFYQDNDNDGYGNAAVSVTDCIQPPGYVTVSGDCNDANAAVNPGATELCNGIDDNCDGLPDAGYSTPFAFTSTFSCLPPGDVVTITWTGGCPDWMVKLHLVNVTLNAVNAVVVPSTPNTGSYTWTVPANITPDVYRFYIEEISGPVIWHHGQNFFIAAPASPIIVSDNNLCAGESATLTASFGDIYAWSNNGETTETITVTPTATTTYTVTVTDANGCAYTAEATVNVIPVQTATISGNTTICSGASTTLSASIGDFWLWSTNETTADITVNTPGTYTVTITAISGCTSTASVNVVSSTVNAGISFETVPYVAFGDALNGWALNVKKFDGTNWLDVGPPMSPISGTYSLKLLLNDNIPYVAYIDNTLQQVVVKKFDGTLWQDLGSQVSTSTFDNSISFTFSGPTPYIAYHDALQQQIIVKKYDGSTWVAIGNPIISGAYNGVFLSLAVYGGTPYLAFRHGTNGGEFTVLQFNGVSWIPVGNAGFVPGTSAEIKLDFIGSTPIVAFRDPGNGDKISVMEFNSVNSTWGYIGLPGFSSSPASLIDLTVSGLTPYVSYSTYGIEGVKKFDGATWIDIGDAGGAQKACDLAFSGSTPYLLALQPVGHVSLKKLDGTVWAYVGPQAGIDGGATSGHSSLALSVGDIICAGESTTLTASGGDYYLWSNNGETTATITVTPTATTTYTVTVTDANGCTGTAEATITVNPAPVAAITGNAPLCSGAPVILTASGGGDYEWSTTETTAAIVVSAAGTYTVTVTDANGCTAVASEVVTAVPDVTISGNLHTKNNIPIADASVDLSGDATATFFPTLADGDYMFGSVPGCSDVTVTPSKNGPVSDCISVLDMQAILKHITSSMVLPTPYCIISADVNNSGSINALDLGQIKNVILGTTSTFPNSDSWTFVDANYVLDPFNPFSTGWPESVSFTNLTADGTADFVGVEMGNVIGCPDPNAPALFDQSVGNFSGAQNSTVSVPVTVTNFNGVAGFQFSVSWDPAVATLNGVSGFALTDLNAASFNLLNLSSGQLSVVWLDGSLTGQTLANGATLFNLNFTLIGSPGSSTALQFTNTPTIKEAVNPLCQPFGIGTTDGSLTVLNCSGVITGESVVCYGTSTTLTASPGFVSYDWSNMSGQNNPATTVTSLIYSASPGTYTVTATDAFGCQAVASFTVTAAPQIQLFSVSGGGAICPGSTTNIYLSNSEPGVTYQVYKGTTAVGPYQTGNGGQLSFPYAYTNGTHSIWASTAQPACTRQMKSNAVVSYLAYPGKIILNGNSAYCQGNAGVSMSINNTQAGVQYALWRDGNPDVLVATAQGGSAILFAPQPAGDYYVVATNSITGCTTTSAIKTITVNPLPMLFNVTGGGTLCSGGPGVPVGLDNSEPGVTYQLKRTNSNNVTANVGVPIPGGTGAISFGSFTIAGTYTVVAKTAAGCTVQMSGNAVVTVISLPNLYSVTGGGAYCAGGTGMPIGVSGSQYQVTYELYRDGLPTGIMMGGLQSGGPISFGNQTAAGVYTVVATTDIGGCSRTMNSSKTLTIKPLPMVFNVTGGGTVCSGAPGGGIGLGGAEPGVMYRLRRLTSSGSVTVNTIIATISGAFTFGNYITAGTYIVEATISGCTVLMNGNAIIQVVPLPTLYNITGGGTYCAGGAGVALGLSGTQVGVTYQLYLNNINTPVGPPVPGNGFPYTGTIQPYAAGTYFYVATTDFGGCTRTMKGTKTVIVKPAPVVTITGPSSVCFPSPVTLTASGGGTYKWSNTDITASTTRTPLPPSATYTVTVTSSNGCSSVMSATVAVIIATAGTDQTICDGSSAILSANTPAVGTGAWSMVSGPDLSLSQFSSTTDPLATFTPSGGSGAYTLQWTVTNPACSPLTGEVVINVLTLPSLTGSIANQVVCNGVATAPVNFTGAPAGAVFQWTCDNPAIGLSASGTSDIPAFTAVNTGTTPVVATVTVTPVLPGKYAYISDYINNTVWVIDVPNFAFLSPINVGDAPFGVCVHPDGSRVYVANTVSNTVSVINTATNTVTATIPVGVGPSGVCVSRDGTRVYVANSADGTVSVIDAATNAVLTTIGVGLSPWGIAVSPDGSRVYVANSQSHTVSVINTATNAVSNIGTGLSPNGVAVTPDGSRVYVTNLGSGNGSGHVTVINTATNSVLPPVIVGNNPTGISIAPDGSRVYVSNYGSNTISVISTSTNTVMATSNIGTTPYGNCVTPDGISLFVTRYDQGTVSRMSTATNASTGFFNMPGSGPRAFGNFIGGNLCSGTPVSFTITVNPSPSVSIIGTVDDPNNPGNKIVTVAASGGTPSYSFDICAPPAPGFPCVPGVGSVFDNVPPGNWLFKVTDANGCTGAMIQSVTLAPLIADDRGTGMILPDGFDFTLYPNPVVGGQTTLHFSGDFAPTNANVQVYNYTGLLILEQRATDIRPGDKKELPIKGFPAGMYRVTVWVEIGAARSRPLIVLE